MTVKRISLCPGLKSPRISYKAAFGIDGMESTTETKHTLLFLLVFMLCLGFGGFWFWVGFFWWFFFVVFFLKAILLYYKDYNVLLIKQLDQIRNYYAIPLN